MQRPRYAQHWYQITATTPPASRCAKLHFLQRSQRYVICIECILCKLSIEFTTHSMPCNDMATGHMHLNIFSPATLTDAHIHIPIQCFSIPDLYWRHPPIPATIQVIFTANVDEQCITNHTQAQYTFISCNVLIYLCLLHHTPSPLWTGLILDLLATWFPFACTAVTEEFCEGMWWI